MLCNRDVFEIFFRVDPLIKRIICMYCLLSIGIESFLTVISDRSIGKSAQKPLKKKKDEEEPQKSKV